MNEEHPISGIRDRLIETAVLIMRRSQLEMGYRLRSSDLTPPLTFDEIFEACWDVDDGFRVRTFGFNYCVAVVQGKRRAAIGSKGGSLVDEAKGAIRGRLLAYMPNHTLRAGLSESETDGFFDGYDAPPWDSWICSIPIFGKECASNAEAGDCCILSLIPDHFLEIAEFGVEVNTEKCIFWADDERYAKYVPLLRSLRLTNLI